MLCRSPGHHLASGSPRPGQRRRCSVSSSARTGSWLKLQPTRLVVAFRPSAFITGQKVINQCDDRVKRSLNAKLDFRDL